MMNNSKVAFKLLLLFILLLNSFPVRIYQSQGKSYTLSPNELMDIVLNESYTFLADVNIELNEDSVVDLELQDSQNKIILSRCDVSGTCAFSFIGQDNYTLSVENKRENYIEIDLTITKEQIETIQDRYQSKKGKYNVWNYEATNTTKIFDLSAFDEGYYDLSFSVLESGGQIAAWVTELDPNTVVDWKQLAFMINITNYKNIPNVEIEENTKIIVESLDGQEHGVTMVLEQKSSFNRTFMYVVLGIAALVAIFTAATAGIKRLSPEETHKGKMAKKELEKEMKEAEEKGIMVRTYMERRI